MKAKGGKEKAEGGGRRAEEVVSGQRSVAGKSQISNLKSQITNPQPAIPNPSSALRPPLSILLLGNTDRAEFHDARIDLNRWGTVHEFTGVDAVSAALQEGTISPDLIVIAQTFPGQFSHRAIDQIRRLAPLARVIGLMGSWCEGEMRTGSPWPAVVRTYWHQWAARSHRQLGRLAGGECCSWTLPPTASEEERLLADMARYTISGNALVVISAQSVEMAQWLSAACRGRGYATVWQRLPAMPRVEGAAAAIFDGTDLGREEYVQLQRLAAAVHPAPVIALLAFPRIEDRDRARSAGATAVVSKPASVDDLLWEVERKSG